MIRNIILIAISMILSNVNGPGLTSRAAAGIPQTPLITFGLVSDVQYCDCDSMGTRFYRNSLSKLTEAIDDFNSHDLDFTINLGDLIDRNFSSYDSVMPILRQSSHTVRNVAGNHEYNVESRKRKDVNGLLGIGDNGYYSFVIKGFRFIILNSFDLSTYSPDRKKRNQAEKMLETMEQEDAINGYDWNGGISDEQLAWFRSELDKAVSAGELVIVFSHHPAYPVSEYNILNYKDLLDIAGQYNNIKAWFSGHDHAGAYGNLNLVHYVTFRGMVETEDKNAYAVVELYTNKIWIKGRGREKSMILAY